MKVKTFVYLSQETIWIGRRLEGKADIGYRKRRELKKIEGREFTLRIQKNNRDSVRLTDETQVPMRYRTVSARIDGPLWERLIENVTEEFKRPLVESIHKAVPSNEAIKNAVPIQIAVTGAEVYRGDHLRVA
jgi:hypothetical protein